MVLTFPLVTGEHEEFPGEPGARCPVCGKAMGLPHSLASISGGAVRFGDDTSQDESRDGFLHLSFHGSCRSKDDSPEETYLFIAEKVAMGQWTLCFCSIPCLRQFLDDAVDELSNRVRIAQGKP